MKIEVKKLNENATVPTKSHNTDAGWDLYSSNECDVPPNFRILVETNISMKIPDGYYGQIFDRSGNAFKKGLHCMAGVIDSSYRGEIKVLINNTTKDHQYIEKGDRIAQMIILPVPYGVMVEVKELDETKRGAGGFGSTDK